MAISAGWIRRSKDGSRGWPTLTYQLAFLSHPCPVRRQSSDVEKVSVEEVSAKETPGRRNVTAVDGLLAVSEDEVAKPSTIGR